MYFISVMSCISTICMAEEKIILKVSAIVAILASVTAASVFGYARLGGTGQFAYAQKQGQSFHAKLTGKDEVPPKDAKATGTAEFTVTGADSMKYKVSVTDMEKVTAAHIHKGKAGENGPVVATLFKTDSPSATTNGLLSQGTVTSAKLEGPLAGKHVSDVVNMINNGDAYVNVHTQANPKGEIRGQLSSS
jgi:CHRD domain